MARHTSFLHESRGVNLNPKLTGLVGFTEEQVCKCVGEGYTDYGFDRSNLDDVLVDLKAFYDGYQFLPDAEPLYNSTICNWYLFRGRVEVENV